MLALDHAPQSMEEPLRGSEGQVGVFGELLVEPLATDAYEQVLDHAEIEQVRALLASLNERERMILRARYGLDGPEQSLRDIGEQLGLRAPISTPSPRIPAGLSRRRAHTRSSTTRPVAPTMTTPSMSGTRIRAGHHLGHRAHRCQEPVPVCAEPSNSRRAKHSISHTVRWHSTTWMAV